MHDLKTLVECHNADNPAGITSVCSAHPMVIEAAVRHARATGNVALIEATSNQVDQDGGYTGMTPADFYAYVGAIADNAGLDRGWLMLGGDHLGPNRWQGQPAEDAMAKAEMLIRDYVAAGFKKIHLDCSMACADDTEPLADAIVAERAARLAQVAERTAVAAFGTSDINYVVGTEVPVPGGAQESLDAGVTPTEPAAADATIQAFYQAFTTADIADTWKRVVALVVQPGVEFSDTSVVDFKREPAHALSKVIENHPNMVFEAHSTDYQTRGALTELVQDHFAILKVGPGLTFALREALFALEDIESFLVSAEQRSGLQAVIERRMCDAPAAWQSYYHGSENDKRFARRFSFSDRIRYYWPDPDVQKAQATLFSNLDRHDIPLPLLSRFMPDQYRHVREQSLSPTPHELVIDRVTDVLRDYAMACAGPNNQAQ
ncbi:D-tagatose-bisphosphate aldolase, class II, non-catalytic subunit [Salinisphaera sp. USBA-960]|uniref:D-tagatose-bisphosphate aldolase, class II, non-catalytic subunit n=1 Tax=Salinisphaera orenii TaxID=856731 RepID=UPI000DBE0B8C|nr:D-tagatose-bisphosphate aldolase, class II, non-catalytic subunit [Salifodinibacter halophilus]NNC26129.1 D-tagatose-bisphosphate aldolase, class II, non-catalytic subunit [Salifodinibacter halophilus]